MQKLCLQTDGKLWIRRYEAHVNDSTDYQVYGNSLPDSGQTDRAVEETEGTGLSSIRAKIVTTLLFYFLRTNNEHAWKHGEVRHQRKMDIFRAQM